MEQFTESMVQLELLSKDNEDAVLAIERDDVPEDFVEAMEDTISLHHYGNELGLNGLCFAIKYGKDYVGLILFGEAIEGDEDPDELKGSLFFRLIGFVIDRRFRGNGIGAQALSDALKRIYQAYGKVPILLECHKDNHSAIRFYEKAGFFNTRVLLNNDYFMIKS